MVSVAFKYVSQTATTTFASVLTSLKGGCEHFRFRTFSQNTISKLVKILAIFTLLIMIYFVIVHFCSGTYVGTAFYFDKTIQI